MKSFTGQIWVWHMLSRLQSVEEAIVEKQWLIRGNTKWPHYLTPLGENSIKQIGIFKQKPFKGGVFINFKESPRKPNGGPPLQNLIKINKVENHRDEQRWEFSWITTTGSKERLL